MAAMSSPTAICGITTKCAAAANIGLATKDQSDAAARAIWPQSLFPVCPQSAEQIGQGPAQK